MKCWLKLEKVQLLLAGLCGWF